MMKRAAGLIIISACFFELNAGIDYLNDIGFRQNIINKRAGDHATHSQPHQLKQTIQQCDNEQNRDPLEIDSFGCHGLFNSSFN